MRLQKCGSNVIIPASDEALLNQLSEELTENEEYAHKLVSMLN
jgi:hypothetical protein